MLSGNSSDKKSFAKSVKEYKKQFEKKKLPYVVADSALFTKDGLSELSETKWVSRVPETVKQAREEIRKTTKDEMTSSDEKGYSYREIETTYADIKQRWLIVYSQKAYNKEYATLVKAGDAFNKKLKYHTIPFTVVKKKK